MIHEGASARLYECVFVDGTLYIGEHGRPGKHAPILELGSEFRDYLKREDAKGAVGLEIEVELKKAGTFISVLRLLGVLSETNDWCS